MKANALTHPDGHALTEHYKADEIGSCTCGVPVRKIIGSSITSRIDGVRYARPDDVQGWDMFRCRECRAVISESYVPPGQPDPRANLLARFCATSDVRDYLCYPNRIGAHIYATNGWIGIRVPDDGSLDARECDKLDSLPALFETPVAEFIDMPTLPEPIICKACSGKGREYKETCGDCDGKGEFEHGSHTYDCKCCDGAGKVQSFLRDGVGAPCEDCGGTGHDKHQIASVGSSTYLRNLLEKIAGLPGAKIQSHAVGCHPARFIFDGGEGAVMPCRV